MPGNRGPGGYRERHQATTARCERTPPDAGGPSPWRTATAGVDLGGTKIQTVVLSAR